MTVLIAALTLFNTCTDAHFHVKVPIGACCQRDGETYRRVRGWQDRPGGLWVEMYLSPAIVGDEPRKEYFFTIDHGCMVRS